MSDKSTLLVSGVTGGAVVGASASLSVRTPSSLLNTSWPDILAGNFVLYGSDITTVMGLVIGVVGTVIGVYRVMKKDDN